MRKFYLLLIVLGVTACGNSKKTKSSISTKKSIIEIPKQNIGKDWSGNDVLVGTVSLEQLKYFTKDWLKEESQKYPINSTVLNEIKPLLKGKDVVLVMGTWCEDSQREVPGMIKVLEESEFPMNRLTIITVDEDKVSPNKREKEVELFKVPTLIFYDNGEELNRIVEFPIGSLEQDILSILKEEPYKNAYAE